MTSRGQLRLTEHGWRSPASSLWSTLVIVQETLQRNCSAVFSVPDPVLRPFDAMSACNDFLATGSSRGRDQAAP